MLPSVFGFTYARSRNSATPSSAELHHLRVDLGRHRRALDLAEARAG